MPNSLEPFSCYSGPRHPRILWVGEAFGADEDKIFKPFVGETGKEFWRMLGEAAPDLWPEEHQRITDQHRWGLAWVKDREGWMHEAGIAFTNVFNLRPPNNKIGELCVTKKELPKDYSWPPITDRSSGGRTYLHPNYLPQVSRLQREIIQSRPNLVVACGNTACWALLRSTSISSIRGATTTSGEMGNVKVLPTCHPATVLYKWSQRPIFITDAMKAFREGQFPEIRRPQRHILINPELSEVLSYTDGLLNGPCPLIACDTETSGGIIDTIGFAASESSALVIPFGPHRLKIGQNYLVHYPVRDGKEVTSYWSEGEELQVWNLVFRILESPKPKLFQNGLYDLQYLLRMGCHPNNILEDTMLQHHALFPELPKGLGFLGSIYTDEASWKLMRTRKNDSEKRDE